MPRLIVSCTWHVKGKHGKSRRYLERFPSTCSFIFSEHMVLKEVKFKSVQSPSKPRKQLAAENSPYIFAGATVTDFALS